MGFVKKIAPISSVPIGTIKMYYYFVQRGADDPTCPEDDAVVRRACWISAVVGCRERCERRGQQRRYPRPVVVHTRAQRAMYDNVYEYAKFLRNEMEQKFERNKKIKIYFLSYNNIKTVFFCPFKIRKIKQS